MRDRGKSDEHLATVAQTKSSKHNRPSAITEFRTSIAACQYDCTMKLFIALGVAAAVAAVTYKILITEVPIDNA